jgi:hypothetical protein
MLQLLYRGLRFPGQQDLFPHPQKDAFAANF